jgi:hypothetical protein
MDIKKYAISMCTGFMLLRAGASDRLLWLQKTLLVLIYIVFCIFEY